MRSGGAHGCTVLVDVERVALRPELAGVAVQTQLDVAGRSRRGAGQVYPRGSLHVADEVVHRLVVLVVVLVLVGDHDAGEGGDRQRPFAQLERRRQRHDAVLRLAHTATRNVLGAFAAAVAIAATVRPFVVL